MSIKGFKLKDGTAVKYDYEALDNLPSDSGLSNEAKVALLNAVAHVTWSDANGLAYYNALFNALDVKIPCTSIGLDKQTISELVTNTTNTITATVIPSNTTDPVIWSSSDDSVATVSDGVVTGVSEGNCVITATCGNYNATCAVEVVLSGVRYSLTNSLTNCSNSNSATTVYENQTYSATLVPNTGYEFADGDVAITMNGVDVTATAFDLETGNVRIIVSGNIVITATANEKLLPTWTSGTPYTINGANVVAGVKIQNGAEVEDSSANATDYLNCVGIYALYYNSGNSIVYWYDRNKAYITSDYNNKKFHTWTPPVGACYFRVSGSTSVIATDGSGTAKLIPMATPTESATLGVQEIEYTQGEIDTSTGAEISGGSTYRTGFIPLYGASDITIMKDGTSQTRNMACYDKDKNFIEAVSTVDGTGNDNHVVPRLFGYAYVRLYNVYANGRSAEITLL